jgi:RND family efflux transporter MFP subunit
MAEANRKRLLTLIISSAALMASCSVDSQTPTTDTRSAAPNKPAVTVRVFEVQPSASASGDLVIPAALSVEDTAVVLAERNGRIVSLRGQESSRVSKGESLAQFNDEDERSQLRQAELDVKRLEVEEQQYQALVKLNRSELDRELTLAKDGLSSKSDVERAQYKLDQSVHEYEKTRLATESARARVEAAKLALQKSTVRAPISGVVTKRHVTLGTNVAQNDKLFEISSLANLEVKFRLPQTAADRFAAGRIIDLFGVDGDRVIAKARIKRIDPVADATSNTFGYVADVIGSSGLMPGLSVNIKVPRSMRDVSFWVPRAAFDAQADLHNGSSNTLFVVNGQKASAKTVVVSALEGDQVEVVTGLVEADRVVLAPPPGLKDGDLVEVSRS